MTKGIVTKSEIDVRQNGIDRLRKKNSLRSATLLPLVFVSLRLSLGYYDL